MRVLLLIALLVTSPGCVVWYKDFPRPTMTSAQTSETDAGLPAHPGFEQCVFRTKVSALEANVAAAAVLINPATWALYPSYPLLVRPSVSYPSGVFPSWYVTHEGSLHMQVPVQGGTVGFVTDLSQGRVMPEGELACEARIKFPVGKVGLLRTGNLLVSVLTVFIVPFLGLPDTVEYAVTFLVSNPQGFTREYAYRFHKAGVSGIVVLPFVWINFFTSTEKEAFQAVFQQFLFDLQRDRMPAAEKPGGS